MTWLLTAASIALLCGRAGGCAAGNGQGGGCVAGHASHRDFYRHGISGGSGGGNLDVDLPQAHETGSQSPILDCSKNAVVKQHTYARRRRATLRAVSRAEQGPGQRRGRGRLSIRYRRVGRSLAGTV